jgi:hypothetical protein
MGRTKTALVGAAGLAAGAALAWTLRQRSETRQVP